MHLPISIFSLYLPMGPLEQGGDFLQMTSYSGIKMEKTRSGSAPTTAPAGSRLSNDWQCGHLLIKVKVRGRGCFF